MNLLITGGCGFIGSNFIRYILNKYPSYNIINLDKLTYAGNRENLKEIEYDNRYGFVQGDICNSKLVDSIVHHNIDAIINFAAESHVDRSIENSRIFVETNILGTQTLLDAALRYKIDRYIQISTDEVYGSLGKEGFFKESTPLSPNSPYSASKTSADLLTMSYYKTYGLPVLITRCSNNYGPYQYPEKLIPLFITNLLDNKKVPLYGDGLNVRDWIHVEDHCSAVDTVLHRGLVGEIYNIGGNCEKTNREITETILRKLDKSNNYIEYVEDRLGHDRRYAVDCCKLKNELIWAPKWDFNKGIEYTISWYMENEDWWRKLKK